MEKCRLAARDSSCPLTPGMCLAASYGPMLVPLVNVVKGSFSFGSAPEAGPKRRHHSTQYAVRAVIPSSVRSGIRALIASSSRFAKGVCPSARCRLSDGIPVSGAMIRPSLSG